MMLSMIIRSRVNDMCGTRKISQRLVGTFSASKLCSKLEQGVGNHLNLGTFLVRSKPDFSSAKPIATPIFQTGAFESGDPYFYTRAGNPNFEDVEDLFTYMDKGSKGSVLLSSGMAAISGALSTLEPGDRVVANTLMYGCSVRFIKDYCLAQGVKLDFVDLSCDQAREKAFQPAPNLVAQPNPLKLVFFETPTNPFLQSIPIRSVSEQAKRANPDCLVVVDNTWATPMFQRPLELGADVAVYSCSKFFSGHSDVILGLASCASESTLDKFKRQRFYHGAVPDPFAAWLLRRSMQTLEVRMNQHLSNTEQVVKFLKSTEWEEFVDDIYLPAVDGEQLTDYGGLLFFQMRGVDGVDAGVRADKFADSLQLFDRGTPMATVRSAVAIPYTGSHASMTAEEKAVIGLGKNVVRLSIGIENADDLVADLKGGFQALCEE